MALLQTHQVTMQFGGLVAVKGVDFSLEQGMIASLIGPNGAGKTTFFNMLTGLYRPSGGQIWFDGQEVTGCSPDVLTNLGLARTFQNLRLFKNMSVLDNVLVGQHCRLRSQLVGTLLRLPAMRREEARAKHKALELLEYVGLGVSRARESAKNLSYGEQRRLEMARALATRPKLLLLDEPTAGMNPNETYAMTQFIARLRQDLGLTILLIEHDMDMVMGVSDRVSVMDAGAKIAEGAPQEVHNNPLVVEAYLGKSDPDSNLVADL